MSYKKKAGQPPGSLIYSGKSKEHTPRIHIIDYNKETFFEEYIQNVEDCEKYFHTNTITWINITGIHNSNIVEKFGTQFKLHSLVMEDILHPQQRPKMEEYEDHLFLVVRAIDNKNFQGKQISFVLTNKVLLTFQEDEQDIFDPIRERLRNSKGRIRNLDIDYLLYAFLDAMVDNFFLVLEDLGENITNLEEKVIKDSSPRNMREIHNIKTNLILIRKSIFPAREIINSLLRDDKKYIKKETVPFLRDLYDHIIQVMDSVETYRDTMSGMMDLYLSSVSNRTNEIMKVLTLFASIFIPLTFVTGIYGMNFDILPELHWRHGYLFFWFIIMGLLGGMIIYFRKKNWL